MLEYVRNICDFFACICECGPPLLVFWRFLWLISVKSVLFVGEQRVGIIVEDILDDVFFVSLFFIV
jgi:hypothetical protein